MRSKILINMAALLLFVSTAMAQTQKFTGKVVSEADGEPLVGATVKVVGSSAAAITDLDGNFSITANPNSQITVSYIGFKPKTISVSDNMVVKITDGTELDEVVVTGYQVQPPTTLPDRESRTPPRACW